MNKIHEWVNTGLTLAVLILVLVGGNQSELLGGSTRFPNSDITAKSYTATDGGFSSSDATDDSTFTGGIVVGSSGTSLTKILKGTCNLISDASITATTTAAVDCAVTGAVAGDTVFVQLATTTPTTNLGWHIIGANASSTSGFITVQLQNLTGGNAVPSFSSVGSSTQYLIIR